ncbi:MAG: fluoride efflux transporter CrcB [Acidimicrobiia bacterium]|nr:fluoride efflux transporter CrcB [Acidimicrobiia bacterium]
MKEVIYVALGGAAGSVARYLVDRIYGSQSLPLATLTVNLVGSFVLGLLVGWVGSTVTPGLRLALFTGLLGGFTTFSTFALETSVLMRAGQSASAIVYLTVSVAAGVALAAIGLVAGESLA